MLFTMDYVELLGGIDLNPLIVKKHEGVASKGFSSLKYRVVVYSYFTNFFSKKNMKEKSLQKLAKAAVQQYFEMGPEDQDMIPPVVIIIANNPDDSVVLHQALNELEDEYKTMLWSHNRNEESKVLVLERNEILSTPRI